MSFEKVFSSDLENSQDQVNMSVYLNVQDLITIHIWDREEGKSGYFQNAIHLNLETVEELQNDLCELIKELKSIKS